MNRIQIPEGYVLTDLGDGSYCIVPANLKSPWEPEIGEWYECIDSYGKIVHNIFRDDSYSKNHLAFYNVFPLGTAKAAARQIKYAMALARVKAIVEPEFEPDWDSQTQCKWEIFYSHNAKCFKTDCFQNVQSFTTYFSTEDKANEAIELLNQWGVKP